MPNDSPMGTIVCAACLAIYPSKAAYDAERGEWDDETEGEGNANGLRAYTVSALQGGSFKRKKSRDPNVEKMRDRLLCDLVDTALSVGLRPTRNRFAKTDASQSATSVVVEALGQAGLHMTVGQSNLFPRTVRRYIIRKLMKWLASVRYHR